jgi:hypothetical protein
MTRRYAHSSPSQVVRSASFLLLLPLSLLILTAGVNAQTTEVTCRETQKVLDQLGRDRTTAQRHFMLRNNQEEWRGHLSTLRKAIANRGVIPQRLLENPASHFDITTHKKIGEMSIAERLALQKTLRPEFERQLQEALNSTPDEFSQRIMRLDREIGAREQRIRDLKCNAVSKGRQENEVSIDGTWTGLSFVYEITQTGATFRWKITNDLAYNETANGELKGKVITARWTNRNGTDSAEGEVTEVDSNGRATRIRWKNGVVFQRN